MANLHRLRRGFCTSYTPWKPNLNSLRQLDHLHLAKRRIFKPYKSLRLCLLLPPCWGVSWQRANQTQPHLPLWPSNSVNNLLLGTKSAIWSDHMDNVLSSSFSNQSVWIVTYLCQRVSFVPSRQNWDLKPAQDEMGYMIVQYARFLQLLNIKLIMATFQLRQGNCNIYFQCALSLLPSSQSSPS